MAHAQAVADFDRLPWLTEPTRPTVKPSSSAPAAGRSGWVLPWASAGVVLVAAASYLIGMNSQRVGEVANPASVPQATIRLPEPVGAAPAEQASAVGLERPEAPRAVEPAPTRQVRTAKPKVVRIVANPADPANRAQEDVEASAAEVEAAPEEAAAPVEKPLTYWPASESTGASGRVVRIGTFSSRLQAKRAWWKVVKVYPGMQSLNAVVAPVPSRRNGRTYYRLQFGTTSQAHSEILCQRMRVVGQSCSVVGLSEAGAGG